MFLKATVALGAILMMAGSALAAEPIEGTWKRSNGTVIKYAAAGSGKFCGTVLNGEYKGQSIGCMSGSGKSYKGQVNKLDEGKTYSGNASVNGNSMKLAGCVAMVLCKSETLTRQ
ncbi:DUF2147 domain-containing protein [Aquamicrobium sp. LC103]|uniref:DUF2147 domain-containing protein n=1 Tax=Aquamicrobium sp. LC103 TaxID=1120658 RepID=UPI00063E9E51|nr:DUF2147 domain-containing protein [Aquamicrobium sp. LC103]TKT81265.1 DUF2147 domain-containing protein [Aquamicrobium sp. LC103]